jgi:hypothetical protein
MPPSAQRLAGGAASDNLNYYISLMLIP